MSENVQGMWTLSIGGKKWDLEGAPNCVPTQIVSAKVQDSAGRVIGNKQTQVAPVASFTVLLTQSKTLQGLIDALTNDTTVVLSSSSTGQAYTLTGARMASAIAVNDHTAQVEAQGDLGKWA